MFLGPRALRIIFITVSSKAYGYITIVVALIVLYNFSFRDRVRISFGSARFAPFSFQAPAPYGLSS